ncbi:lipopolysaccharide biosynthesis protein [Sphingobium yanoikuyae]|uniref:lipopolysaccharide biosynthesis protein n=1 Tax=Sphingobium yanoikuyae TaxID=13690 RepID=UPI00293C61EB|nr:hypothetical protein [Sphingobium yanoikuyae]MDV3482257.1 hypothetical protein [Sphingobium yanoikuyae]
MHEMTVGSVGRIWIKKFSAPAYRIFSAGGPIFSAVAMLGLTLAVVPLLSKADYGYLAFCIALTVFGNGVINATAGTPLSILLNQNDVVRPDIFWPVVKVSTLISIGVAGILFVFGIAWERPLSSVAVLSCYGFLNGVRWIQRSYQYARHRPARAALSDLIASLTILAGVAILIWLRPESLIWPSVLLAVSIMAGFAVIIGRSDATEYPLGEQHLYPIREYRHVWREQSRWALLGIVTTEMAVNGHIYVVTTLAGPAAFSPIAIATLAWRPAMTIITAMTLLERPRLAAAMAAKAIERVKSIRRQLRYIFYSVFVLNLSLIACAMIFFKKYFDKGKYDITVIGTAMALWMCVIFVRTVRTQDSVFLQAAREFRPLAMTSVIAAPVSLVLAAFMTQVFNPLFSIVGIILGEITMTCLVIRLAKKVERGSV